MTKFAYLPDVLNQPPPVEEVDSVFGWTLARYHKAIEAGILTPNDKVELLFGQLIPKIPVGEPHAETITHITEYFFEKYGLKYKLRGQNPITLPNHSEPEPDLAIVVRKKYNEKYGHPKAEDTLLLIEVAKATLRLDRGSKARAYALANVKEYWIINLQNDLVEVHLQPQPADGLYKSTARYARGESFASPFCGETLVDDLLLPLEEE